MEPDLVFTGSVRAHAEPAPSLVWGTRFRLPTDQSEASSPKARIRTSPWRAAGPPGKDSSRLLCHRDVGPQREDSGHGLDIIDRRRWAREGISAGGIGQTIPVQRIGGGSPQAGRASATSHGPAGCDLAVADRDRATVAGNGSD